jgi:hypothetical protein
MEEKRVIEIINMLAKEGTTYGEARKILKAAEFELGKRQYNEKVKIEEENK